MRKLILNGGKEYQVEVAKITLGSTQFGSGTDRSTSMGIMEHYYELGGRSIDTAKVYGSWTEERRPLSEQVIGEWLRSSGVREEMTVITKGCHPDIETMDRKRVGASYLCQDVEESLNALQTDYIDLYFLHRDDRTVPVEELIEALNKLQNAGMIRAFGASNWSVGRIDEANQYARSKGLQGFCSSQVNFSLAHSNGWEEEGMDSLSGKDYEFYLEQKIPVLAWGALAGGIFMKGLAGGIESVRPEILRQYDNPVTRKRMEQVTKLCQERGITPAQACLGYITCNPLPAAALVGVSKVQQLQDLVAAADLDLLPAELERLAGNDR